MMQPEYHVRLPYWSADPENPGWRHRYVHMFECFSSGDVKYLTTHHTEWAVSLPEPVAEWLCGKLQELGVVAELEEAEKKGGKNE